MHDDRPLSGDWYDLRAWWRVRRLLVREPELSLEGRPRLGVSAVAFARFLWILLPTALLGLLAAGVALLPDRPESAYEQTARLAEALRAETLAASAVPGTPEASEGTRRQLAVASAMAFLTLGQPLVDDASRAAAAQRYRALLASAQRSLSPAQFERRKAGFARELRAAARKLRWLERLQESGLSTLMGFLFIGALLPVLAGSFRWMVRRMDPRPPHAGQAGEVYLYAVVARLTPWYLLNIAGALALQAAIALQSAWLSQVALAVLMLLLLPLAIGHFRAGATAARVLTGESPDRTTARRYGWRLLAVLAITQVFATVWIGVFTLAIELLSRME